MVAQKELDEQLRQLDAKIAIEENDWKEEERKLFELEEAYLRDSLVQGNAFTGWGEPRSAPIRFRNAALRKKKRERGAATDSLTADEQLKVDKNRFASYSSLSSPAEFILQSIPEREKTATAKAAVRNAKKAKK